MKLLYNGPAKGWSQGLPLGNGRLGAVLHGGAGHETWNMTEITFWSGKSERFGGAPNAKEKLAQMREAFFRGDYAEGDKLAKETLQPKKGNFGTNLSLCDVLITYAHEGEGLMRELDLETAVASISYRGQDAVPIQREYFASHADGVVAARIAGERKGKVSFTLRLQGRTDTFATWNEEDGESIGFRAQATESIHSDGTCGVMAQGLARVAIEGGKLLSEDGQLTVEGADAAVIYFAVATDFGRENDDGWLKESREKVEAATTLGFEKLKESHVADYRSLYGRVSLELDSPAELAELPTDVRIRRLRSGQTGDLALIALFYQYGRYLTIAGSREDSPLPLNLQGIWNDGEANRMAWSCDYHLDVNTQMNYYPTEISNLAECHVPLMNYIERLAEAGRAAATDFYGADGWVAHVFSNAWGFASPGWETSWGLNVTGGLWIAMHMKEHYEYGLDRQFLTRQAYPVMKQAALFFLDYMTVHPKYGWLVTGPSNSPENSFFPGAPEDGAQQLSMGTTMDQMLVHDLFVFCLEAAEQLQIDAEFRAQLRAAIRLLPPLMIGKRGQLQEWLEDYEEAQPEHRHFSHLYGLYPGSQIDPEQTPELAAAIRNTLLGRMQQGELEDIEFTAALFASGFSRLHDGDRAASHVRHLIGELCFDNLLSYSKPGVAGAETNIFVIDGNFGGTAAIADMLLQSHAGVIHLLPALPQDWASGSYRGLRAKGGIEVDATWESGRLGRTTIKADKACEVSVRYGGETVKLTLEAGLSYRLDGELNALERASKIE
ncbi:glycoside hydrolase family 95 protein [Paenibacillus harenae]|uniref:Alpha-L-fucosidase 2 n=1 Tax=Paenibacillus harenae TaxID=306543 RepID=A0ABT9U2V8_PAEHA|nr:glycoside hydrolase N-terminal domain-containing protein [Paenibacillus harenae]MDQ0113971.1 alpha-L-fucosidase 2 [Paenibacillus harenae]